MLFENLFAKLTCKSCSDQLQSKSHGFSFFSISKPQEALAEHINEEKIRFDDVINFNTPEGYNLTTLRVLASMKLVNCFCPKAVYFINADVDSYLRIEKLEKELHKLQKQVDRDFPSFRINANGEKSSQGHVLLNGGGIHALFPKEILIKEITNTSRALTRNNQPKLTEDNVVAAIDRGGHAGIRSAHQFYTALENKNSHGH